MVPIVHLLQLVARYFRHTLLLALDARNNLLELAVEDAGLMLLLLFNAIDFTHSLLVLHSPSPVQNCRHKRLLDPEVFIVQRFSVALH